jgi:hypothetical protein
MRIERVSEGGGGGGGEGEGVEGREVGNRKVRKKG